MLQLEKINGLFRLAGVRQADIARSIGINQSYLSQILAGRKTPSLDVVVALASALGVSVGDIIDDSPSAFAESQATSTKIEFTINNKGVDKMSTVSVNGNNVQIVATIKEGASFDELKAQLEQLNAMILASVSKPIVEV